jgi:NAD(P)H-hydrate epimerase
VIPVVTPAEMAAIDAAAPDPVEVLIDRAGAAVARVALDMLGGAYGRTVGVIAGPGNNGADGRVAAERLRRRGARVAVHDARRLPDVLPAADLVIDAGFGTGFRGEWSPPDIGGAPVLAVDVPTGLDALTGERRGRVLAAERTVTFAAAKPGQLFGDGPDLVGELIVADIGLDVGGASVWIVEADDVAGWLPRRDRTAHKWQHAVRVVAGSEGMSGAAALASAAAMRAGAGMVVASAPHAEPVPGVFPHEVVTRRLAHVDWSDDVLSDIDRFSAMVIGPGLGRHEATIDAVRATVAGCPVPVVVDGDGLVAIAGDAGDDGPASVLRRRRAATVLTPHDGEFTRLTGSSPEPDRVASARRLADDSGAVVLLKGATTVVAAPDHDTYLMVDGDQRLATAGTGDVLAGIIAALLAGGVAPAEAAAGGAWIHARAAAGLAPLGLVAGDLIAAIPHVLDECGHR